MAYYGEATPIYYTAYSTATGELVSGDSANHTITLDRDGTVIPATGDITDLGGGNYKIETSDADIQAYTIKGLGTSSTADVVLFFEAPIRTVKLPNVLPGETGGLAILKFDNFAVGNVTVLNISEQAKIADIRNRVNPLPLIQSGQPGGVALTTANGVLTEGQQAQIDAIETSIDTLGTGDVVAINPVGSGGKITLYSGIDYTAATVTIDIPDSSPSTLPDVDSTVSLVAVTDQSLESTSFTLTGVVVLDGTNKIARFTATSDEVGESANYRYLLTDTPSGTLTHLNIVGNLVVLDGIPTA